jgi:hypothetical protein
MHNKQQLNNKNVSGLLYLARLCVKKDCIPYRCNAGKMSANRSHQPLLILKKAKKNRAAK